MTIKGIVRGRKKRKKEKKKEKEKMNIVCSNWRYRWTSDRPIGIPFSRAFRFSPFALSVPMNFFGLIVFWHGPRYRFHFSIQVFSHFISLLDEEKKNRKICLKFKRAAGTSQRMIRLSENI